MKQQQNIREQINALKEELKAVSSPDHRDFLSAKPLGARIMTMEAQSIGIRAGQIVRYEWAGGNLEGEIVGFRGGLRSNDKTVLIAPLTKSGSSHKIRRDTLGWDEECHRFFGLLEVLKDVEDQEG